VIDPLSSANLAREIARRLRAGKADPAIIAAAAESLESLADLLDRCMEVISRIRRRDMER